MIGRYAVLAGQIRQDLIDLELVVARVERAVHEASAASRSADLFFDSAALNLHDFYAGLERIFLHVASEIDQRVPKGSEWHREVLRQMTIEIPGLRPAVLPVDLASDLDEFLRFRHVVRHIYAFELDAVRIKELAIALPSVFEKTRTAVLGFLAYLQDLSNQA